MFCIYCYLLKNEFAATRLNVIGLVLAQVYNGIEEQTIWENTCTQRTLLLGNPDTHQVLLSSTQQKEQQFVLRSPSAVNHEQCLCRPWTVTRYSFSSPGGCSCLLPLHRACKLAPFLPRVSRTYPTHLPRSLLNSWYRPRLEERERSFWFRSLGEWRTATEDAPARLLRFSCSMSVWFSPHLCAILNLGNTKHLKVNGNHFFLFLLWQNMLKWPIAHHFRGALWATFQQIRFIFVNVVISTQYPENPAVIERKVVHHNCIGCS